MEDEGSVVMPCTRVEVCFVSFRVFRVIGGFVLFTRKRRNHETHEKGTKKKVKIRENLQMPVLVTQTSAARS